MSGGASIIVTGVLMTVNSECSVVISSLSEGECSPTQPPTTNTSTAIIGGVVAVINPRRACAARVTVVGLSVCPCNI